MKEWPDHRADTEVEILPYYYYMGPSEKAAFAMGVASIRWEPLFRLTTCEEKYSYYQTIVNRLMEHCFPIKIVTRHTADKPWITDLFRNLIRKRQRAY